METMKALRLTAWGREAELVEAPVPAPGPRDVLVRVGGAGACQSDLHLMHEFEESTAPWAAGFVLGHENAGWIVEVGSEVRRFAEGETVAVVGAWGCGRCERCSSGTEPYCDDPEATAAPGGGGGLGLDGGMAEYMIVRDADRHLVHLPDELPPHLAAPLTDAAVTAYHAVRRSLRKLSDPRSTAVVIGAGGLGQFGVQVLKALTATTIAVVETREPARARARTAGADHVFAPSEETAEQLRGATGGRGADVVLDFVGSPTTLALAAAVVRPLGDLTIVGAGGGNVRVGFGILPYEVSVQTTFWGGQRELTEVVDLAVRGLIDPSVTTYRLDDALTAYRDLADGKVGGRAVVVP